MIQLCELTERFCLIEIKRAMVSVKIKCIMLSLYVQWLDRPGQGTQLLEECTLCWGRILTGAYGGDVSVMAQSADRKPPEYWETEKNI